MAERIRAFVGSSELEYSEATINKSNDTIVDNGFIVFGGTAVITNNSTIEFRKNDGTTKIFSGIINELKKPDMWEAKVYTNGYELLNLRIEQVYTDKSPEYIVQDVVGNTKNLVYNIISNDELVGYWRMDDNAKNKTVKDSSLESNTGTSIRDTSTVHATGYIGGALTFDDGSTDYIDCGDDSSIDLTGPMTISAWIYKTSYGTNDCIISKGETGSDDGYVVYFNGASNIAFGTINGGVAVTSNNPISANTWHHVVFTYDGTPTWFHLHIWVDGTEEITYHGNTFAGFDSTSESLKIGAYSDDGVVSKYFNGLIDDLRIYSRKLSDTEISDLYNNGSNSSGTTISKYIANGYAIDIIQDMMNSLGWQIRIDENDNFYFEPPGTINNGKVFTNGDNIQITSWEEDKSDMVNRIKIKGGFESFSTTETAASGTSSILSHKPSGAVRVLEGGTTEIAPASYLVDAENKIITYGASTLINPEIRYNYSLPIIVDNQDDGSITLYGEIFKEIQQPEVETFEDARKISQNILNVYSSPLEKVKGYEPSLNFDVSVGEKVQITDDIRSEEDFFIISKITYDAANNTTSYEFGERDSILSDWNADVQNRIKKLEKKFTDEDQIVFTRTTHETYRPRVSFVNVVYTQSPEDSFIVGHKTLGRVRTDLNFEADCSDNGNNGTWSGTGIGGSQYTTDGFRLSYGTFNGSDNKITVPDDSSLDFNSLFTASFAVRADPLPSSTATIIHKYDGTDGYKIEILPDNKIQLTYKDSGSTTTFKTDGLMTADEWFHITFVQDGTSGRLYENGTRTKVGTGGATRGSNTEDLLIGTDGTNYFDGDIDEVMLINYDEISLAESDTYFNQIYNKIIPSALNSQIKCYLSMDNPRVGDRAGATVVIS